jgi:2-iminobutanoate/2-iminopropanoate deaminase
VRTVVVQKAPRAIGPYSHAVVAGGFVFLSGQVGLDPGTMKLRGTSVREQAGQALENIASILGEMGLTLRDVVKTTVFLRDMADFDGMNEVYAQRFSDHKPARTTVAIRALPVDALIEIECVALLDTESVPKPASSNPGLAVR